MTPVRESVFEVLGELEHVHLHEDKIKSVAERWVDEEFELPRWKAPVFPDETNHGTDVEDVINFFFVGNSINFAFRDFETGEKFVAVYDDVEWSGAFGMWACLKREYENGTPILSGSYLASLSREDVCSLFNPADGKEIPLLEERHKILNNIGKQLENKYSGYFHNLTHPRSKLFAEGEGIVDCLVNDFPSFDDTHTMQTQDGLTKIHLYKRAQLAPAMVYTRFYDTDYFELEDPESLTIFADYNLPNVLRHLNIIEYDRELATAIDEGIVLDSGSREEMEIRVATVAGADLLLEELNKLRDIPVYAPHLDYRLFKIRDEVDDPVHKTRTTDY